jgi:hypothetical protein
MPLTSAPAEPTTATSAALSARAARFAPLLALAALAALAMIGFPPWEYTRAQPGAALVVRPAGYAWLFAPPEPETRRLIDGVRVDTARLTLQLAGLACATFLCALAIARMRAGFARAVGASTATLLLDLTAEIVATVVTMSTMLLSLDVVLLLYKSGVLNPSSSAGFIVMLLAVAGSGCAMFYIHARVAPRLSRWIRSFGPSTGGRQS